MEAIVWFIDLFLHLDRHLTELIQFMGPWTYVILFLVIFCETGLVVTPLLPGDSLLFALGTFAALGSLQFDLLLVSLITAAIIGDSVNYALGKFCGPRVFCEERARFLKREYLDRTHKFYEKHGGKTIFLARFLPIIRTFAPFVAGVGSMAYSRFFFYNVTGAVTWVTLFLASGYYFGSIPLVKNNFSFVMLAIVIISLVPVIVESLRRRTGS